MTGAKWRLLQIAAVLVCLSALFWASYWIAKRTHPPAHGQTSSERHHDAEDKNTDEKPNESFWQRTTNDPVAAFTACLTLFTAVLATVSIVQFYYIIRSDRTARITAEAAKRSADSLINLERPWMVASIEEAMLDKFIETAKENQLTDPEVRITFLTRAGALPSFVDFTQKASFRITQNLPVAENSILSPRARNVRPGEDISFPIGVGLVFNTGDKERIMSGDFVIWFFGHLEYFDVFGERRMTYFCCDHNMGMGCVAPWGGRDENYMT